MAWGHCVVMESDTSLLAKVIARSGQAVTHRPQPRQASAAVTNACCPLCTKTLIRAFQLKALRSSAVSLRIVNTSTGHTCTHGPAPSQRSALITGMSLPSGCLKSISLPRERVLWLRIGVLSDFNEVCSFCCETDNMSNCSQIKLAFLALIKHHASHSQNPSFSS
jgi:hypothetical protein